MAVWNDATFTSDNEIVDGDTYVRVSVYDSAGIPTTITVSGGQIATLFSYENSVVNITGGSFSSKYYVSVQAVLAKSPAGFISDGTGMPLK